MPPASDWARAEKTQPPGPRNPMGRVKLRFSDLLYMHGTADTKSIGRYDLAEVRDTMLELHANIYGRAVDLKAQATTALLGAGFLSVDIDLARLDEVLKSGQQLPRRVPLRTLLRSGQHAP